jgi:hypothetical protein
MKKRSELDELADSGAFLPVCLVETTQFLLNDIQAEVVDIKRKIHPGLLQR